MKFIVLVLFATVATALAGPLSESETKEEGWFIPQLKGEPIWTTKAQFEAMPKDLPDAILTTKFYLYTRSNPTEGQELNPANATSILDTFFNPKLPTFFIAHGWINSYQSPVNLFLRPGYLTALNCNVISVDWSAARLGYVFATNAIPGVGQKVAEFIVTLVNKLEVPLSSIRVAGHSLGAHVAGFTGKNVLALTGELLERIDGLDPALPGFSANKPQGRLSNKDAKFVPVVHTDGGRLGFLSAIGDCDFYMNGGHGQPSCGIFDEWNCSHEMAHKYLAEATVLDSFLMISCATETDAINNSCGEEYSARRMGSLNLDPATRGSFYVPVRSTSPYGLGAKA